MMMAKSARALMWVLASGAAGVEATWSSLGWVQRRTARLAPAEKPLTPVWLGVAWGQSGSVRSAVWGWAEGRIAGAKGRVQVIRPIARAGHFMPTILIPV